MDLPVLSLDHAWHRQRAALRGRGGRLQPPPLVAAGLDLVIGDDGPQVRVGGLIVVFGHFPASLSAFIELAQARLHLGAQQARDLSPVLDTRLLALWAWLPGPGRDCYLELDQATLDLGVWLLGGPDGPEPVDPEAPPAGLDEAFLDALVLSGPATWGGEEGLERLSDQHGHRALLTAARVSERIDRSASDPAAALEVARERWPRLGTEDERPWAELVDQEHPWACAALGRLALRLGLPRAARALLAAAALDATVPPVALFDLGQGAELLGDLAGAEDAFARYTHLRAGDPDGWRRLAVVRVRRDRGEAAVECLARFRANGGTDATLAQQLLAQVFSRPLPVDERARLAGWWCARLAPLREGLVDRITTLRPALAATLPREVTRLHEGLGLDGGVGAAAVAAVLLALPFLAEGEASATPVELALKIFVQGVAAHLRGPLPAVDPLPLVRLAAV